MYFVTKNIGSIVEFKFSFDLSCLPPTTTKCMNSRSEQRR